MRAVICESFGGLQSLKLGQMPEPVAAAGQILVDVHAASVSFMDCLLVAGKYQMRPETPFVPGTDAAGVVASVGEGVTRFEPGDRVACGNWFGAYAEKIAAPQSWAARLPPAVDYVAGSAVRHGYGTAYYGLVVSARLRPGETVFVTGAGGGVGLAAVDVFFDIVGGEVFTTMTRLMSWGGRMLPIGFTSGQIPSVAMNLPLLKNYSILGIFWGAWGERDPQASAAADEKVFEWVAQGKLKPYVQAVLPLEKFMTAMQMVRDRKALGRVVLQVR